MLKKQVSTRGYIGNTNWLGNCPCRRHRNSDERGNNKRKRSATNLREMRAAYVYHLTNRKSYWLTKIQKQPTAISIDKRQMK
jgi:hypothetical protein